MRPNVFRGENDQADEDEENSLQYGQKQAEYPQQDESPADNQDDNAFEGRNHASDMMPKSGAPDGNPKLPQP